MLSKCVEAEKSLMLYEKNEKAMKARYFIMDILKVTAWADQIPVSESHVLNLF